MESVDIRLPVELLTCSKVVTVMVSRLSNIAVLWLLILVVASCIIDSPTAAFLQRISCSNSNARNLAPVSKILLPRSPPTSVLYATDGKNNNKSKGVYVRPSGAIERGSGFFVPGLEGPRVRVLFGTILLTLTALNHSLVISSSSLSLEEIIAVTYSLLVLFQAAIEFGKEELIVEGGSSSAKASRGTNTPSLLQRDLVQQWNVAAQSKLSQEEKDKIQWVAASYLSVTPGTQMLLLTKEDLILYRLGSDSSMTNGNKIEEGVQAALQQLSQSKGGRLALPVTHPAVVALGLNQARTVILQRIAEDSCWVVSSSDQLLAGFTSADLKWLGQLAKYMKK